MTISDKNDRMTVIIPKTLKSKLREIAASENRSMGNLVVKIVEDYVEDYIENQKNDKSVND
ncbi:DNA-binding protein [Bacillus glycinifermentans]|uniref:ribbon-helix-helix domain-containing protein n=1 Tax=Bacillus glycinifermentans TaxID=1664069 RepID=UPI00158263AF|nr:DNA-binding protein [Bacillus glycinifermentans]NUJ17412.1 DNA-binding protein [Bacillus glycinifermentans]